MAPVCALPIPEVPVAPRSSCLEPVVTGPLGRLAPVIPVASAEPIEAVAPVALAVADGKVSSSAPVAPVPPVPNRAPVGTTPRDSSCLLFCTGSGLMVIVHQDTVLSRSEVSCAIDVRHSVSAATLAFRAIS